MYMILRWQFNIRKYSRMVHTKQNAYIIMWMRNHFTIIIEPIDGNDDDLQYNFHVQWK